MNDVWLIILLAFATLVASELRGMARDRQTKAQANADREERAATAAKLKIEQDDAATKLKQDQDESAAKLKRAQDDWFFEQTKKNESLNRELGVLTQYKDTTEAELIRLRDAKIASDRAVTQLTADLGLRSEINTQTKQENTKLLAERDTLLEERATLKGLVDRLVAELEEVKGQVRELQERADERHQQMNDWAAQEMPRQIEMTKLRISIREMYRTLQEGQQAALKALLASREIDLDALLVPTVNATLPESRLVGLQSELDLRTWQQRVLITELTERGVGPDDIQRILSTATETWIPSTPIPPTQIPAPEAKIDVPTQPPADAVAVTAAATGKG